MTRRSSKSSSLSPRTPRDRAAPDTSHRSPGAGDDLGVDEYGMAIAKPGEWLPDFDDAFDLDGDD